ncbi:MAG: ABC transporter permease [Pseudomonadota bacterium]|nr:ABC transporter permease [Pseudomonadota bacterium]
MTTTTAPASHHGFWLRLRALIAKEFRQLLRDRSNLLVGLGLPVVLILIFGYGIVLDVRGARLVVALEDASPAAYEMVAALDSPPYLHATPVRSLAVAREALRAQQADAAAVLPADFAARLGAGDAHLQLLLNGADPTRAAAIQGYVNGAVGVWLQKQADRTGQAGAAAPGVQVVDRLWFNAANSSTWYLVPGLVVLIMTLVGTFLTALVMAREWERGTLESLFVTPVHPVEILLAKIVPYFAVGMVGLGLCLAAARLLFGVPMQGTLPVLLAASMLYMVVTLAIGLLISAFTKNQFIASQVAMLASFMPAMMLSGFMFDLRNVPTAISVMGHLLPATYFMTLIKTLFLAGDQWGLILKNCGILLAYAVLLLAAARAVTRKTLD